MAINNNTSQVLNKYEQMEFNLRNNILAILFKKEFGNIKDKDVALTKEEIEFINNFMSDFNEVKEMEIKFIFERQEELMQMINFISLRELNITEDLVPTNKVLKKLNKDLKKLLLQDKYIVSFEDLNFEYIFDLSETNLYFKIDDDGDLVLRFEGLNNLKLYLYNTNTGKNNYVKSIHGPDCSKLEVLSVMDGVIDNEYKEEFIKKLLDQGIEQEKINEIMDEIQTHLDNTSSTSLTREV